MPLPFLGEIRIFGGTFAPTGWAFCDGQLMPISGNTALFSILGNAYGGDGVSTFALPDLRGRVPLQAGQGPGLTSHLRGRQFGSETTTLTVNQIPVHTHPIGASNANGVSDSPAGNVMARSPAGVPQFSANNDSTLDPSAVASAGGGGPHNNMQPYLTLNYIIALQGIYPSRWP